MTNTKENEDRIRFRFVGDESCLYVDAQENFNTSLRFLPWKKGLIYERFSNKNGWVREKADPGIPLITLCNDHILKKISDIHLKSGSGTSIDYPLGQHPIEMFVNLIPQIVRELAAPFIYRQIPLLQFFCVVPEAVELARSNPVLLWLLVDKIAQEEIYPVDFRKAVLTDPMKILHTINSDWDETSLSFISRISFSRYSENAMKTIRAYLKKPDFIRRLSPLHKIPGAVLEQAIHKPRIKNSPAFLHLLSSTDESESPRSLRRILSEGDRLIREAGTVGKQLDLKEVEERVLKCGTMAQLKRLHWRWQEIKNILRMSEELNVKVAEAGALDKMSTRAIGKISGKLITKVRKNNRGNYLNGVLEKYGSIMFPTPPIKGNESIVSIRDADELYRESMEMEHCVSSYVDSIMQNKCYTYAVKKPERATLEIWLDKDSEKSAFNPILGQLKLKKNALPSIETLSFVKAWIENTGKVTKKSPLVLS
ncbi:MAG TPA: hypothetical protein VLX68_01180 [Chitinivibrionales bacterium]|nr:hypothetical protein [Chitinivibrionales bacterium]